MAHSIPSKATPKMLEWARKQSGYAIEDVEEKERIPKGTLSEWENGKGTPSMAVLRRLAKRYKYTVPLFYLSEPPTAFTVVRDYRLLPRSVDRTFSPEMRFAIRAAQERQAWLSSYLEDEEFPQCPLVGAATIRDDPRKVASTMREFLGVVVAEQESCPTNSGAFTFWRRTCERAGIFVFQASHVSMKEMRGCSLPDIFAPAILITTQEDYLPKIFTLFHELVHIMLGETSVSGTSEAEFVVKANLPVEEYCNRTAAEFLVPEYDFIPRVPHDWQSRQSQVLKKLSRRYWVSQSVIVKRLRETGFASQAFENEWFRNIKGNGKRKVDGPIPQPIIVVSRVGESFSRIAISAFNQGQIHGGQLTDLLGMKLKHLAGLEEMVFPHSVHPLREKSAS